jgi:4-amino-4-deoxy-L-arabinose transferase-like glycosyltransferase
VRTIPGQGITIGLRDIVKRGLRSPALALGFWVITVLLVDIWWLHRFRVSAVPEYDESGYMAIALRDLHAFNANGLSGLFRAYVHQVPEAPLVPLATVVPYLLFGAGVAISVATQLVAVAGLAAATYALGRRLVTPGWAALAAGVMIALPVVTDYSRTFHFAVPAAALLTAAAWALARSDGMQSRRWALLAGVLLGCTVLARTMTIAYLPGVGAAALVLACRRPDTRRRLGSLAILAGATVVVAATWYAPNGNYRSVGHYLGGTGYGAAAGRYGSASSPLSIGYWLKQARVTTMQELYLPLALALLGCIIVWLLTCWRGALGARALIVALRDSEVVIPLLIVVEGYLALTSSRNVGTAFSLPWLPSFIVLCVVCAARLPTPAVRRLLASAMAAASVFAVVMKSDAVGALAQRTELAIPAFGTVPVTDGDWLARKDVAGDGYHLPSPASPLPRLHRQWLPFAERETRAVLAFARTRHSSPTLLVGTGDVILSTTRFALADELLGHDMLYVRRLLPSRSSRDYQRQMQDVEAHLLVTADPPPSGGDVDRRQVVYAARVLGYRAFRASRAPDGRRVTWWWRN